MKEMLTEHEEQRDLVQWFDRTFPELKGRLFAIPNGGHRHKAVAAKQKLEGAQRGVPDLMLPIPVGSYHGLFIEMKRVKGGRTSPEQKDWLAFLSGQGYRAEVCKGAAEAIALIDSYLESYSQN